jgi:hypothetical protein
MATINLFVSGIDMPKGDYLRPGIQLTEVSPGVWYSFSQYGEIAILKGKLTFNSLGNWVDGFITDIIIQNKLGLPTIEFHNIYFDASINNFLSKIYSVTDRQWLGLRVLTSGNDLINGSKGDDIFYGGDGNNTFDGSTGIDKVWYPGNREDYQISYQLNSIQLKRTDGFDVLKNVERLIFQNANIAIDISDKGLGDGNAGTVAKVLGAVFGKTAVTNKTYAGIGLSFVDKGMSYSDLAALALNAAGSASPDQIITTLWTNILGSAPSATDKAPYIQMLASGTKVGDLAVMAADSSFNTNNINLTGLAQTGIEYTPA